MAFRAPSAGAGGARRTAVRARFTFYTITTFGVGCWLASTLFWLRELAARTGAAAGSESWSLASIPLLACLIYFVSRPVCLLPGANDDKERDASVFSLADPFVLLVACAVGGAPAVFLAGLSGLASARRLDLPLVERAHALAVLALAALASALVASSGTAVVGADARPAALMISSGLAGFTYLLIQAALPHAPAVPRAGNELLDHLSEELSGIAPLFVCAGVAASVVRYAPHHPALIATVAAAPFAFAYSGVLRRIGHEREEGRGAVLRAHLQTVQALAVAVDAKDKVTHAHVHRVEVYAAGVARVLGCSAMEVEALKAGSLLHDIGKIAVPDYILNKPGKLTSAEFDVMKMHTVVGGHILKCVSFPFPVESVVRYHHERWDGRGYPEGLKGEEIPLTARILSVVDCFDALREDRPYRRALGREEAVAYLRENAGTTYDPRVVEAFIAHLSEFEAEVERHRARDAEGDEGAYTHSVARRASTELARYLSAPGETMAAAQPAAGVAAALHLVGEGECVIEDDRVERFVEALAGVNAPEDEFAVIAGHVRALCDYKACALLLARGPAGARGSAVTDTSFAVAFAAGEPGLAAFLRTHSVELKEEGVVAWSLRSSEPLTGSDVLLDPLGREACARGLLSSDGPKVLLASIPVLDGTRRVVGALAILVEDNEHNGIAPDICLLLGRMLSKWATALPKENAA